ncbi:hypothetical protein [Marinobacter subterrani]|uniref:hypothetical protein n=1 Tax=Marinobacter subterrani TaxID=1658765 RepID=UPI0023534DDC|nr:hypothetical protein [Marinobacter subterrani]
MSDTLKPVPFFTDDITLIPHTLSSELADTIEKPLTVAEFVQRTGAQRVSLYTTSDFELVIRTRLPNGQEVFAQGPEKFPVYH